MNATSIFRMAGSCADLRGLIEDTGLRNVAIDTRIVIFTSELAAAYFTETGTTAQSAGVISASEFDRWATAIENLRQQDRLFCSIGYYLFTAQV
jgi:hypothetical protein